MASFRSFLDDLAKQDELRSIDEQVDWDLESSAICAMSQRTGGPAVQFANVKDYPGMPLVGSLFSGPGMFEWPQLKRKMHGRMAIALGLEPDIHYDDMFATVMDRRRAPIRAIEIEAGPCQEVVIQPHDVDLYKYPIPRIHDKDGGRYLTSHVVLTRDAETGWTNFGIYRLMLAGRNKLVHGGLPRRTRPSDVEAMVAKYHQRGEALPFAIVIGAPPEMTMAACLMSPPGTDEYALAGGLGLTSPTLVKAKLSDIMVPAEAEIILEGHIYPGEMAEEGPFAWISYYTPRVKNFVYRVELITQRKDPVLPFVAEGAKPSDTMCLFSLLHSVELTEPCRMMGCPIRWITLPVEAKLCLAVVCLEAQPIPGLQGRLAHIIFGMSPFVRQMIIVDPDVDSEDLCKAIEDRSFKSHLERDWHISARADKSAGLTENHDFETNLTSTLFIDATWRLDRPLETIPRRCTFEACFPDDLKERVVKVWNEELKLTPKAVVFKE